MDKMERRDLTLKYTVIAAIMSALLLVAAYFVAALSSEATSGTYRETLQAFSGNSYFWILILLAVMVPAITFAVSWILTGRLSDVQESIEKEKQRTRQVGEFTEGLIRGEYTGDLKIDGEHDALGSALVKLRDTLKTNQENENRRRSEEGQRNWMTEGQAHFGEILRNHVNDLEKMAFLVMKDLTKYIGAIQGGFYMLDDSDTENRCFRLIAFYAYERKKFADQLIKWGDGLIGTCALEKKPIHMKKVPDGYMRVTSGLGDTKPGSILLQPLLHEDEVFGVIEIATMNAFEDQHKILVEKVSGSIGSTLATMKNSQRTARLLEDSKAQAHMLSSQEEEMRQNMEELKATQEEAARQARQYMSLEEGMDEVLFRAELELDGSLLQANKVFLDKFGMESVGEMKGKDVRKLVASSDLETFEAMLKQVGSEKKPFGGKIRFSSAKGRELWSYTSCTCIGQDSEEKERILMLSVDISNEQQQSKQLETLKKSTERNGFLIEMDIHGTLLWTNERFLDFTGMSSGDLNTAMIFDLIASLESEAFAKRWESIIKGVDFDGTLKIITKKAEEKWIRGSFSGIKDLHHQMDRILFTGYDATEEKLLEIQTRNLSDQVKESDRMLRESEKQSARKLRDAKNELMAKYREMEVRGSRNEALLKDASDAIVITSSDNRIVLFNKSAEKLWGFDATSVLDQNIGILFPNALIEKSEFLSRYVGPGDIKITGLRKKEKITDIKGVEKEVVFLISKTKINRENAYIAFVQHEED